MPVYEVTINGSRIRVQAATSFAAKSKAARRYHASHSDIPLQQVMQNAHARRIYSSGSSLDLLIAPPEYALGRPVFEGAAHAAYVKLEENYGLTGTFSREQALKAGISSRTFDTMVNDETIKLVKGYE